MNVNRISAAEEAAASIRNGMAVAMSGYAMAGYTKAVVDALVQRKQSDEDLTFELITGAKVPWLYETEHFRCRGSQPPALGFGGTETRLV